MVTISHLCLTSLSTLQPEELQNGWYRSLDQRYLLSRSIKLSEWSVLHFLSCPSPQSPSTFDTLWSELLGTRRFILLRANLALPSFGYVTFFNKFQNLIKCFTTPSRSIFSQLTSPAHLGRNCHLMTKSSTTFFRSLNQRSKTPPSEQSNHEDTARLKKQFGPKCSLRN